MANNSEFAFTNINYYVGGASLAGVSVGRVRVASSAAGCCGYARLQ